MISGSFDLIPEHLNFLHIAFVYLFVCACSQAGVCSGVCADVRGQLAELLTSFHHVDLGGEIQFIILGDKHVCPLSHVSGPNGHFKNMSVVWSILNSQEDPI